MSASTIRSEVRGLDVILDESSLGIAHSGEFLAGPVILTPEEADRLRKLAERVRARKAARQPSEA